MKKIVVLFLMVALAFSTLAQIDERVPDKPTFIKKLVVIQGDVSWKSTGVTLMKSDDVKINATGQVLFNSDEPNSAVSPNGLGQLSFKKVWTGDAGQCDDPYGKINHAALIAKVGNNGFPFFVGEEKSFSNKEGELFIGINDCTFVGPYANSGQFNSSINITRFGKSANKNNPTR
jgi:hypothetical protein